MGGCVFLSAALCDGVLGCLKVASAETKSEWAGDCSERGITAVGGVYVGPACIWVALSCLKEEKRVDPPQLSG